jgi:hypothetical protein
MTKERKIVKTLNLREISGVTIPAQSPALVSIMKSEEIPIVKYLSTTEGAQSFDAFLAEDQECKRKWEAQEQVWPLLSAFNSSVSSIVADESLSDEDRQTKIAETVSQFVAAMQSPETGVTPEDIEKLFNTVIAKEHETMSEELKKALAEIADLTKKLADAETVAKFSDAEKAYLAKADKTAADNFKAATDEERKKMIEKASTEDEVFKSVTGVEIHKSSVGSGVFELLKKQDEALVEQRAELAKARDEARTVELTKVADTDYGNLPGTASEKVAVLKKMDGMSEAERGTLTAMLKAANAGLAGAFQERGTSAGVQDIAKSTKIEQLAKAYQTEHPGTTLEIAKVAVMTANPDLYE